MGSELLQKLIDVQGKLKAPKGQYNNFGKYKYRSCEDILEAVKPLLVERGLLLTIKDEVLMVGERYYIRAIAAITDGTNSIEAVAFAREEETKKGMDSSQVTGAASSYARKYALNGLFCIDDNKDSDTTNHGEKSAQTGAKQADENPLLDMAMSDARNAPNLRTLQEVWNNYPELKSHPRFQEAKDRRKAELGA